MSTPNLDALARGWADAEGYDLTPYRDDDEPLGVDHVEALFAEMREKLADPAYHFGFLLGSFEADEYAAYIRSAEQSWHEYIESALKVDDTRAAIRKHYEDVADAQARRMKGWYR